MAWLRKSPLCGKWARFFLFCFCRPFSSHHLDEQKAKKNLKNDPKILLCCWASLGDVLLASSILPALRQKWPEAKFGFLCDPKSLSVVQAQNPPLDYIHSVPCWKVKGRLRSLISFFYHTVRVYPALIQEIKKTSYDVSLELHPFFPSSASLAKKGGIPCRIGFASGGSEVFLTDMIPFPKKQRYLPSLYRDLLSIIGVDFKEPRASLLLSKDVFVKEKQYIVLHFGTSDPRKEWDPSLWKELAHTLKKLGHYLVFTGKGERDLAFMEDFEGLGLNLVDKLSFSELATLIQKAQVVISVDSVPVHLAAFLGAPFVALYLYSEGVELWLPNKENCFLLIGKDCQRRCRDLRHHRALYLADIKVEHILPCVEALIGESA